MNTPVDTCRACGAQSAYLQSGIVLDLEVSYFECPVCGYVQTEAPHWLDRAYVEAINSSDTGILARNQINARLVLATLLALRRLDGTVVDCAGGYGFLVRMLRDYGVNALWSDPFSENLVARGFEHKAESAELVTAFEAFEHFERPAEELDKLLRIAPSVLLSTEIIADPAPRHGDWWYYGKEHGQHIGFFRVRTLERLAHARHKRLLSNGTTYHLITDQPVNRAVWRAATRANKLLPLLLRRRLESRTWSDHVLMAGHKR